MTVTTRFIEERPGAGRLGRHVFHDPRSRAYRVARVPVVSKSWPRRIPILDQGDLGSCTGNAAVGALGCDPFRDTLSVSLQLDETEAVLLYGEATVLDGFDGTYPPDDTGSTGLAVAKACKNADLISGYQHALGIDEALAALMAGPVITGVNWYSSFDNAGSDGFVHIAKNADVRGGHEFVVRGVDVETQTVYADNSWSAAWGNDGSFAFSVDDWSRLLDEDGDVTQFVPATEPAPVPDVDSELAPLLHRLVKHRYHRLSTKDLALMKAWLNAKGL